MGLNEYAVLNQVWNGNTHAQQIAEATRFHPQLVKACLVRLQRSKILGYNDGYRPYAHRERKPKKYVRRDYVAGDTPIIDMVAEYLKDKPEGALSRVIAAAINVKHQSLRSSLNKGIRQGRFKAEKTVGSCVKLYRLAEDI